jgi:multiple sugar transport system ATP-binding protein
VAGFIGSPKMNLLKATVDDADASSVKVSSLDLGTMVLPKSGVNAAKGDEVTVGLRPHHLGEAGEHRIEGRVNIVERLGNETLAAIGLASGQQIIAALPGDVEIAPGKTLSLATQSSRASLFLSSGEAA